MVTSPPKNPVSQQIPASLPGPVLLVDDDPFVCAVVEAALAAAGLRVQCCTSGEEALRVVGDFKPALILLDFLMPGMNGRETWKALCACLAALGERAPRGVFITARNTPETDAAARDDGLAGVIAKPFDPLTLVEKLQQVLRTETTPLAATISNRLAAVAAEFHRSLPAAAQEIEHLSEELRSGWERKAGEALLVRAHALSGTAGLFDRHALGASAEKVERLLLNYLKLDRAPDSSEAQKLDAAASSLISECRAG